MKTFTHHIAIARREQLLQNQSKGVNVGAVIDLIAGQLFRGGVGLGVGGLLEDGESSAVGKSEVDDLHMVAVMGNQDVGGLQVLVYDLFAVEIVHGKQQFFHHQFANLLGGIFLEEVIQRSAVHIFHHDAVADHGILFVVESANDVGMVEFHRQGEFLGKHCGVLRIGGVFGLEAFQHVPLSVALSAEKAGVAV